MLISSRHTSIRYIALCTMFEEEILTSGQGGGHFGLRCIVGNSRQVTKASVALPHTRTSCSTDEPAYLGCYRDKVPRFLEVFIPTHPSTIGACVETCKSQGFSIAGLRNSDLCFCGNQYYKEYQTNEKECDMPCYDNAFETCGGYTAFSQYWTGKKDFVVLYFVLWKVLFLLLMLSLSYYDNIRFDVDVGDVVDVVVVDYIVFVDDVNVVVVVVVVALFKL